MAVFSIGIQSTVIADNSPLLELVTSATDYVIISELIMTLYWNAATAINTLAFGIGTPATKGVGKTSLNCLSDDLGNTSNAPGITTSIAWTVLPTIPSQFYRRCTMRSLAGASIVVNAPVSFTFPNGLKLNPSSSLVLWTITSSLAGSQPAIIDLSVEIEG